MTTHTTNRETIRILCQSIVTRLENRKSISLSPRLRGIVADEIASLIGPAILTEQDLRDKVLAKLGANAEVLEDPQFADSDKYRTAKAVVKSTFGDDELHGFYFQKPLKVIADLIAQYLMRSSNIDDVYEMDEDLVKQIVEIAQKFDPAQLH